MEKKNNLILAIVIIALIIGGIFLFSYYSDEISLLKSSNEELQAENIDLQDELDKFKKALSDANSNIEQANQNIENAKGQAWDNYYTMGDALDSLETVDTISEP